MPGWVSLRRLIARSGHFLLVVPLLVFVTVTVLVPVAQFLWRAVDNSELHDGLPLTSAALDGWPAGDDLPGDPAFAALIGDLAQSAANKTEGRLAQRINQAVPGTRTLVVRTARLAGDGGLDPSRPRESLLAAAPGWSNLELWRMLARDHARVTPFYLLTSLDLEAGPDGSIGQVPAERAIFQTVIWRTVTISITVTALCAVLALPVAHVIVGAVPAVANLLLLLVLFPLWTSLLVRTVAWIILLQGEGPVNALLVGLGAITKPLPLVYTRFSLLVAMVQVLLPLMILPILAVLRRLPKDYMRAAASLGATWWQAWWRVQLPLLVPGILTGSGIVFVFALGYFITPTLIGGPREQMLSSMVAFYVDKTLNWGLAAAVSIQLLLILGLTASAIALARQLWWRPR